MLAPARPAPGNQAPLVVPEAVKNTEDLTLWLHREARGKRVDLQGRALRPKGGYEKDVYGLDWHEHPHPHWYLPFVPAGTTLANGTVVVSPRIALVCEGPGVVLEDLSIEGAPPGACCARRSALDRACFGGHLTHATSAGPGLGAMLRPRWTARA